MEKFREDMLRWGVNIWVPLKILFELENISIFMYFDINFDKFAIFRVTHVWVE